MNFLQKPVSYLSDVWSMGDCSSCNRKKVNFNTFSKLNSQEIGPSKINYANMGFLCLIFFHNLLFEGGHGNLYLLFPWGGLNII